MSWNYRVCTDEYGGFTIYEVYYDEKGQPYAFCGAGLYGDSIKELRSTCDLVRKAFEKPVLLITKSADGVSFKELNERL